MASPGAAGSIRLDKLLWYLRFARSRSVAQAMIGTGHIRLDGRRITRSSAAVHVGQTLVLPVDERIEVLRLLALPGRRGPAAEAQACYERLQPTPFTRSIESDSQMSVSVDASPLTGIGGGESQQPDGKGAAGAGSKSP